MILEDITEGIILHQTNCQGKMGTGIALAIRNRWPVVYRDYLSYCWGKVPRDMLGTFQLVQVDENLYVGNVFGQLSYGCNRRHTDYEAVQNALIEMRVAIHPELDHLPIYYPKMGCKNAGGDWTIVSKIIDECLDGLSHQLLEDK